jgi:hypothetical protein
MKTLAICLALSSCTIAVLSSCQKEICDTETRQIVAEMYAAAISSPDEFPDLITQNRSKLLQDRRWKACADRLASQLASAALSSPSRSKIEERAADITSSAGLPHFKDALVDEMMKTAVEMARLSNWLSTVVNSADAILQGNPSVYYSSEVYQTCAFVWNTSQSMLGYDYTLALRTLTYQGNVWMITMYATQVR